MEDLRRLTATRGAHRGQITKLTCRAEELVQTFDTPTATEAQLRTFTSVVESITNKYAFLQKLDDNPLAATEVEGLEDAIVESDDYLTELKLRIDSLRIAAPHPTPDVQTGGDSSSHAGNANGTNTDANNVSTTSATSPRYTVNLPKLELPKFDGDILKWITFHDAFTSMVHDNQHMNDIHKFQYLIAHVTGEAARTIEGLRR